MVPVIHSIPVQTYCSALRQTITHVAVRWVTLPNGQEARFGAAIEAREEVAEQVRAIVDRKADAEAARFVRRYTRAMARQQRRRTT